VVATKSSARMRYLYRPVGGVLRGFKKTGAT